MDVKVTRDQLLARYNELKAAIEKIETAEAPAYKTTNKFIPGIGCVHEIDSQKGLVKAMKHINEQLATDDDVAQDLGITPDTEESQYLGFSKEIWKTDIKTRVIELQQEEKLVKYEAALKVIKRNLSQDDVFSLEMGEISDVLADLSK